MLKWLGLKLEAVLDALSSRKVTDFIKLSETGRTVYAISVLEEFAARTWLKKLAASRGVTYPSGKASLGCLAFVLIGWFSCCCQRD